MAHFTISKADDGKHTWKAEGTNPKSKRKITFKGGQAGKKVGSKNPEGEKTFDARHDAQGEMTPKKYVNKLRWDDKAAIGSTIDIPDNLFNLITKKPSVKK
ncbi:MAG: hypothetical protein H7096_11955 [Flavobacterium sp.]|nr:hypothetical protein [Pedobacter sp.]